MVLVNTVVPELVKSMCTLDPTAGRTLSWGMKSQ
jgi:hypothetical protein